MSDDMMNLRSLMETTPDGRLSGREAPAPTHVGMASAVEGIPSLCRKLRSVPFARLPR